ncbi:MAG: hypothetical protein R6V31_03420 [Halohasta sp.]
MTPLRPDLVPDPSLSRDEMEILQRTVAADAEFIDRLPFDPAAVIQSTGPADATESTQSTLTGKANPEQTAHDSPIIAGVDQAFLDDTAISAERSEEFLHAVVLSEWGEVGHRSY